MFRRLSVGDICKDIKHYSFGGQMRSEDEVPPRVKTRMMEGYREKNYG
jgi:hypothetical protein